MNKEQIHLKKVVKARRKRVGRLIHERESIQARKNKLKK